VLLPHVIMRIMRKSRNSPIFVTITIAVILFLAIFLRLYNLNWDQNHHLHPDERMITIVVNRLKWPDRISQLFTPQSPMNPKFFAYGSFPLYLLKIAGDIASLLNPKLSTYNYINLLGRAISALFDVGTILLIKKLGEKVFNYKTGIIAALFYAFSVLPIQLSHFYTVDIILTFFILATLYRLTIFYEKPNFKNAVLSGFCFGIALATKVSATALLSAIIPTLLGNLILITTKKIRNIHAKNIKSEIANLFQKRKLVQQILKPIIPPGLVIATVTVIAFLLCQPYALIDFPTFWRQIQEQHIMTKNAFAFPYTLQYFNTIPYFYHLKNYFLWGAGPALGMTSLAALIYLAIYLIREFPRPGNENQEAKIIILFIFTIAYFAVIGRFAVKFMRYLLPLYPLFCLFAAYFLKTILSKNCFLGKILFSLIFSFTLFWSLSFLSIYHQPHTRISASKWINQNIPSHSVLAIEHWDDSIPLFGQKKYQFETLELYNPDTSKKWQKINQQLKKSDYIIIASNRLYIPLSKLTNCAELPPGKCYPQTSQYYQKLFSGQLGFSKIAEFTSYPKFKIGPFSWTINDSSADESFTVYDHPQIMIFQKDTPYDKIPL